MPPTTGNRKLLAVYDQVSRDLGYGEVKAFDPGGRGAADIAFVASQVDGLDGLGVDGDGAHSVEETIDLRSLLISTKRAALMIYRLIR
jgi:glutamate carboxypeptidase